MFHVLCASQANLRPSAVSGAARIGQRDTCCQRASLVGGYSYR
jgi:hypothetical protein